MFFKILVGIIIPSRTTIILNLWAILFFFNILVVKNLGFTLEAALCLTIIIFGFHVYFSYYQYSGGAWIVAVCILYMMTSGISLLHTLSTTKPQIPEITLAFRDEKITDWDTYLSANENAEHLIDDYVSEDNELTIHRAQRQAVIYESIINNTNSTEFRVKFRLSSFQNSLSNFSSGQVIIEQDTAGMLGIQRKWEIVPILKTYVVEEWDNEISYGFIFEMPPLLLEVGDEFKIFLEFETTYRREPFNYWINVYVAPDNYHLLEASHREWRSWSRGQLLLHSPRRELLLFSNIVMLWLTVWTVYKRKIYRLNDKAPSSFKPEILSSLGISLPSIHHLDEVRPKGMREGVILGQVELRSIAGLSGLQSNDVIVKIGRKRVNYRRDLKVALSQYEAGDKATLKVLRDGKHIKINMMF